MRFILAITAFLLIPYVWADGTEEPQTAVKLYRGTTIIAASDPNHATYRDGFTLEACRALKDERWKAEAATKTSGSKVTYKCQFEERSIITFHAPPTCAPPRAPETQQVACPNDPTRTFTQTRTWTVAPYSTCEIAGAWLPATPSATDCPPTQLAAPSGVEATAISTSEIRIRWNVVPDAVAYSVRRCIGATCDPMSRTPLACTQNLQQAHVTLNPGITVRYQVEASRVADCSGTLSQPSSPVVSATTLTTTPPPPDPDPTVPRACAARVCDVSWTPEGPAADGFRIFYSRTDGQWAIAPVQVAGMVTRTNVTMPETGIWYFAVKSFIGANESELSNVVVRDVQ